MFLWMVPMAMAAIAFGVNVWQFAAAMRFPLHRRSGGGFTPGITIHKPLKGADVHTRECLESWLGQRYDGPVQILFGVHDAADPVCAIVRELLATHPQVDARLVVCPERLGTNAKVSTLVQLHALAAHAFVLVCDADVHAPPDLLAEIAVPMRDPGVGLVNCFYRQATAATPAMRWEATAVNADFWGQVLQSRALAPMDFALGAAMLLRGEALAAIGGFLPLADHLADDFQLGNRVVAAGYRVEPATVVVECRDAPAGWPAVWAHQLRWNRTIRACRPLPYAASILSNVTATCLAAGVAAWFSPALDDRTAWRVLGVLAAAVLVRCLMARALAARLAGAPATHAHAARAEGADAFAYAPLKDLLGLALWIAALGGDRVEWRGVRYRVGRDGRLKPLAGR